MIDKLREQGLAIIYISHYLQEMTQICDCVTVLRNGKLAGTLPLPETSIEDIVTTMVGREIDEMYPPRKVEVGAPRLHVENLTLHGAFEDISIDVGRGEVIGVTGLLGSGLHPLAETLYGLVGRVWNHSARRDRAGSAHCLQGGRAWLWHGAQGSSLGRRGRIHVGSGQRQPLEP